jgi:ketosteroid isomerase-like protein
MKNVQESTRDAMAATVERLRQAAEHLDADGVLAMCRSSEGFLAVSDGVVNTYDQFAAHVRDGYKELQKHRLTFDSLHIRNLGDNTFASLALFHQMETDLNGVDTYLKGEVTWVFNHADGGPWKLTYLHAWHMPDTDQEKA